MHDSLRPAQEPQKQGRTDQVRDHGRQRDAVHGHPQNNHEKHIQNYVHNTRNGQADQRCARISLCTEDSGFEVVEQDDRHARQIDPHIEQGHIVDLRRHAHQVQKGRRQKFSDHGDHKAPSQCDKDRRVHSPEDTVSVILPDKAGDHHVCPQRDPDKKIDHQADDRGIAPDSRHRVLAHKTADDRYIRRIEQLLQDPRRR